MSRTDRRRLDESRTSSLGIRNRAPPRSPSQWKSTNSQMPTSEHGDGTRIEIIRQRAEVRDDQARLVVDIDRVRRPHEDERRLGQPSLSEQRPEVGVMGDDHPVGADCEVDDLVVGSVADPDVSDVNGIVTRSCQQPCDTGLQICVDDKVHAGRVSGSSRSWTAAAAYSRAAGMSAGSRSGKSTRIASEEHPLRAGRVPSPPESATREYTAHRASGPGQS